MKLNFKKIGLSDKKIVILHGLFGSLDNWMTHGKHLAESGFEVYLVDQRNHGKSPHQNEHNYQLMASDLHQFLVDQQIENPFLLGHSMGGKTVMQFVMEYNYPIQKLVVVDIAPKFYLPHHKSIINAFLAVDIQHISSRIEAEEAMRPFVDDQGVLLFLMKNLDRTSAGFSWKINLPVLIKNIDNIGETYLFSKPCQLQALFIRGAKSDYIVEADRDLIKLHFPNANLVTIRDAGHWVHAEQYDNFMKTLLYFLNA
jgi:esterase